jgi:hypothetical protein
LAIMHGYAKQAWPQFHEAFEQMLGDGAGKMELEESEHSGSSTPIGQITVFKCGAYTAQHDFTEIDGDGVP